MEMKILTIIWNIVNICILGYLPKTAHMVRKAMATSKEGMRTFMRDAFLPSETKIKSTFQWKVDSFCDVKILLCKYMYTHTFC